MHDGDDIGVVRDHPRVKADAQRKRLEADGCRAIIEIGKRGGHQREDVERLLRPGTVVKFVHTFLLAEPKARRKAGGWRKDLLDAMGRIERKGGTIKDVDSGLTTDNPEHRYALVALATDQLARNGRGLRSARNGAFSRGRPVRTWTLEEWKRAKAAWESRKLKTWKQVQEHLPDGMTTRRAWQAFGPRSDKD